MMIVSNISGNFFDVTKSCSLITQNTIINYIIYLKNTNIKDITVNSYLRGLRVIISYFISLGYTNSFKITLIKAEKAIKETYSDNELILLLKKPDVKRCDFSEYRNWVIVNYLIGTGNRASTVVNVKIRDIDFSNKRIILTKTKNRKQQIIPLSSALIPILREYIKYRQGDDEDYLFCNAYGNKLTVPALQHAIYSYNKSRGVMKTSLHLFRHTFAKSWIMEGGSMFDLQEILGHSCLEMVKEYVNMFNNDLQRHFDKFSPLERFKQTRSYISMEK